MYIIVHMIQAQKGFSMQLSVSYNHARFYITQREYMYMYIEYPKLFL